MSGFIYDLIQHALGSGQSMDAFIQRYMDVKPGSKILDVGCGTSRIAAHLPDGVEYVGVDPDGRRLSRARALFGHRHGFTWAQTLAESGARDADHCLLIGVLHHLTDAEVRALLDEIKAYIRPGGRIVTLDGVFHGRQNPVARVLVAMDRGRNVRDLGGYATLLSSAATVESAELRTDMMRLPYSHAVCTATVPMR